MNLYWKWEGFPVQIWGEGDGVFFDEEIFCKLDFMYRMAVYSN